MSLIPNTSDTTTSHTKLNRFSCCICQDKQWFDTTTWALLYMLKRSWMGLNTHLETVLLWITLTMGRTGPGGVEFSTVCFLFCRFAFVWLQALERHSVTLYCLLAQSSGEDGHAAGGSTDDVHGVEWSHRATAYEDQCCKEFVINRQHLFSRQQQLLPTKLLFLGISL